MTAIGWRRTSFLAALLLLDASLAWAAWPTDPGVNLPLSTLVYDQTNPRVVPDGANGAIFTWQSVSADGITSDVYAQRVDLSGAVKWTVNGVALSTAAQDQMTPVLVPDGAGGAIVAWEDFSVGPGSSIFAQRINATGVTQWTGGGIPLSGSTNSRLNPAICSDGAGGAFVVWQYVSPGPVYDVRVQRVISSGSIAPGWPADGVVLTSAAGDRLNPVVSPDGAGGAIVAWQTGATISTNDVLAQRVNASGALQWGATGVVISAELNSQYGPLIVSDGAGGAILAWQDTRNGTYDIYAQRVSAAGAAQWTSGGVSVCPSFHGQIYPTMVSDAANGAIIAWQDSRSLVTSADIYAQRLNGTGVGQWTAGGVAVCSAPGVQQSPAVTTDGAHGAVIAWEDEIGPDVFARRVNAAGVPQWAANGVAISNADFYQVTPVITTNGAGGGILAWQDSRNGNDWDLYAENVNADGTLGGSLASVPGTLPAVELAIRVAGANPGSSGLSFAFSLPDDSAAQLDVFDLSGRVIDAEQVGALGAGTHVIAIHPRAASLSPGVYCVRLTQGARRVTTKAVLLR